MAHKEMNLVGPLTQFAVQTMKIKAFCMGCVYVCSNVDLSTEGPLSFLKSNSDETKSTADSAMDQ